MTPAALIDRDDAVLIVIDVQERLLPVIDGRQELVANIVKLLRFADIADLPIVLTEQGKLGETVPPIQEELPDVEAITKLDFSCFGSEDFREALREMRRRTLLMVGIEAHICVAQTALAALADYRVHVVADGVASRRASDKQAALDRLRQAGCVVTSTEMLMYEILRCAGTDEFRAVLKLVKDSA